MPFPLSQLLVGAANARNAYSGARRDAQAQAQQQQIAQALQAYQMKRQAEQDALAAALQASQVRNIDSEIAARSAPKPLADQTEYDPKRGVVVNRTKGSFTPLEGLPALPDDSTPHNPVMGSPEWLAAQEAAAKIRAKYAPAPQQSFTPVTATDETGTAQVLPFNTKTGQAGEPIGGAKPTGGGMGAAAITKAVANNDVTIAMIDRAITELEKHPDATGLVRGIPIFGEDINQRVDSEGVDTRALIANVGSAKIHDRTGASMTAKEEPRLMPFIPGMRDRSDAALKKLKQLREFAVRENEALRSAHSATAPTGGGRGGGPGAPSAAPSPSGKPDLAARIQQLKAQGLSKDAAKKKLLEEGYNLGGTP